LLGVDVTIISQWEGYPAHVCEGIRQKNGKPVVYWAFDFHQNKPDWHLEMAKEADLFLSPEIHHRAEYEEMGANFHWMLQEFSPEFLDRVDSEEFIKKCDVLFTGSYVDYGTFRTDVLKEIDKNFDLRVFSMTQDPWKLQGLKNVHPPAVDHELPELIAQAKINISVDLNQKFGTWSDRNSQIMCCGGFVLFKYIPYSEMVFGDKITYFKDIDDCIKKIDYYLKNDKEREKIADEGYKYAQANFKAVSKAKKLMIVLENRLGGRYEG